MTIKIAVSGRAPIDVDAQEISLGSAPGCTVPFVNVADVKPKHAVIRMIAGRWLVEVREADAVFVGSDEPKRMQWLKPGDVIRLSLRGPEVIFQPSDNVPAPPTAYRPPAPSIPLSDSSVPTVAKAPPPLLRRSNPPSSATIPVSKPEPSESDSMYKLLMDEPAETNTRPPASRDSIPNRPTKVPSDSDDLASNAPMLHRISPNENPFDNLNDDDLLGASVDPDTQWIRTVVYASVGSGLVFLIIWLAFKELWKAVSGQ